MNGLDLAVAGVLALSTLLAFVRGVVRELIALATWVVAIGLAFASGGEVAARLPEVAGLTPPARQLLAFALVFVAVVVAGALAAHLARSVIHAAGLGFVDRFLGAGFGLARGLVVVLAFAVAAGMTALPQRDWWQNAALGPWLAAAALAVRPWLPPDWAGRLDYSPADRRSAGARVRGGPGENEPCVES